MTGPDPAAATAAWLASIPQAVQAAAARHAQAEALAWALGMIGPVVLALALVRSGLVERAWRGAGRRGPAAAGAAVIVLLAVASTAWDAGVAAVTAGTAPGAGVLCVGVIARALLFAATWALLEAVGRRPRLGLGVIAVAGSFLLVFGPEAIGELAGPRLVPAPADIAAAAQGVARASGVKVSEVVLSTSAPGEGDVVGLFGPARVLLRPEAVRAPLPEVRAGVGHVLGHYRAHDELGWALLLAALGAGGVVFVIGGYGVVAPRDPSPSRGRIQLSDPRALPALWALMAVWIGLAQPAAFAWDRAVNLRADRFSLEHAREPDGLVLGLIRQNGLQPVDPPLLVRLVACSHPPLKARIDQAMRWKAGQAR